MQSLALVREDWDRPINSLTIVYFKHVVKSHWDRLIADISLKREILLQIFYIYKPKITGAVDYLNALNENLKV